MSHYLQLTDWVAIAGLGLGICNAAYTAWNELRNKPRAARQERLRDELRTLLHTLQTWHRESQTQNMKKLSTAVQTLQIPRKLEEAGRLRNAILSPVKGRAGQIVDTLAELEQSSQNLDSATESNPRYSEFQNKLGEVSSQLRQEAEQLLTLLDDIDNAGPLVSWWKYRRPHINLSGQLSIKRPT